MNISNGLATRGLRLALISTAVVFFALSANCQINATRSGDLLLVLNLPQKQGYAYTVVGWNKVGSFQISPIISGVFVCPTGHGAIFAIPSANSIQVWSAAQLNQVKTVTGISGPVKVFFDNLCSQAIIVGNGYLFRFDLSKQAVTQTVQYFGGANNQNAIASPDGTKIYLAENGNIISVDFVTLTKTVVGSDPTFGSVLAYANTNYGTAHPGPPQQQPKP